MKKFLILSILPFLFIWGCKRENKTTEGESQKDTISAVSSDTVKEFYLVPAPKDIFGFSEDKNLTYHKDYLNPVENLDKYNDSKLQEFNFGVYSADLAYSAAFNKKDESAVYLDVIKKLSDKIGLSEIFNEKVVNKIQNVEPNKDSLIALSTEIYFDIKHFLERNHRENSIAIIAAGGWLETMYLVIKQVEYQEDNPTIQKIADQKIIFDNLMRFLSQYNTDPNVASLIKELTPVKDIYDKLQTKEVEGQEVNDENKIVVGGNKKLTITKDQFDQLKNSIISIRNTLTLNNEK